MAHQIEDAGAHLRVTERSIDTATSAGRAFFGMLADFAQFETDVRRDRQGEGIARQAVWCLQGRSGDISMTQRG
ncbi:MAG: recombinase family protein [Hyphomicrobiaceae bacterium]|nr:MAG: recombinase family protein [Hyphomicrobiaceae bacterium]